MCLPRSILPSVVSASSYASLSVAAFLLLLSFCFSFCVLLPRFFSTSSFLFFLLGEGSMKWVHCTCLSLWIYAQYTEQLLLSLSRMKCEVCQQRYRCRIEARCHCGTAKSFCSFLMPTLCLMLCLTSIAMLLTAFISPASILILPWIMVFLAPLIVVMIVWAWITTREFILAFRRNCTSILISMNTNNQQRSSSSSSQDEASYLSLAPRSSQRAKNVIVPALSAAASLSTTSSSVSSSQANRNIRAREGHQAVLIPIEADDGERQARSNHSGR